MEVFSNITREDFKRACSHFLFRLEEVIGTKGDFIQLKQSQYPKTIRSSFIMRLFLSFLLSPFLFSSKNGREYPSHPVYYTCIPNSIWYVHLWVDTVYVETRIPPFSLLLVLAPPPSPPPPCKHSHLWAHDYFLVVSSKEKYENNRLYKVLILMGMFYFVLSSDNCILAYKLKVKLLWESLSLCTRCIGTYVTY